MIGAFLRWVILAAGLACGWLAWGLWTGGMPPLWSFAAPRAETVVKRAELMEGTPPGGGTGQHAEIEVAWPPGSEQSVPLLGMWSAHQRWHLHVPMEVVRDHPAGAPITVRVIDGLPVADRLDATELANAVGVTLMGLIMTVAGLALLILRFGRRKTRVSGR